MNILETKIRRFLHFLRSYRKRVKAKPISPRLRYNCNSHETSLHLFILRHFNNRRFVNRRTMGSWSWISRKKGKIEIQSSLRKSSSSA